jgi:hypothetical protein
MHSEGSIIRVLDDKYKDTARFRVSNIYVFKDDWETDFFVVQKASGYCYDIEIKITRSDFFADFKKRVKHLILQTGAYEHKWSIREGLNRDWTEYSKSIEHNFRPNKFYYCVPEGLITVNEVPEYAGLMYVSGYNIKTVKEAPFIHKEKLKFEARLCDKFYWYWKSGTWELRKAQILIAELKEEIKELKNR